jgi:hypothetical protein
MVKRKEKGRRKGGREREEFKAVGKRGVGFLL